MYFLIALVAVGFAAALDLKYREVAPALTYSLILAGLALHAAETYLTGSPDPLLNSVCMAVLCFSFAYLLYKVGFWAGGDVKLFTGIGAMVPTYGPFNFFPFWILVLSFFVTFPFAIVYVSHFFIVKKKLRDFFAKEAKKSLIASVLSAASITTAYSLFLITGFWPVLFTAPVFYFLMVRRWFILIFAISVYPFTSSLNMLYFLYSFVFSFIVIHGFACLKIARKEILQEKVKAKNLKEGMILAYNIILRKGKPAFEPGLPKENTIAACLARGLTAGEIAAIRKYKIPEVEIKKSLPFIPLLFGSMILLAAFEKFFMTLVFG